MKIYLHDPGIYEDKILMTIDNDRTFLINLKAVGTGCSIIFQPNIFPTFDMGLLLGLVTDRIIVENNL